MAERANFSAHLSLMAQKLLAQVPRGHKTTIVDRVLCSVLPILLTKATFADFATEESLTSFVAKHLSPNVANNHVSMTVPSEANTKVEKASSRPKEKVTGKSRFKDMV